MAGHCIFGWSSPYRTGRTAHRRLQSLMMGVKTIAGRVAVVAVISAWRSSGSKIERTIHSWEIVELTTMNSN